MPKWLNTQYTCQEISSMPKMALYTVHILRYQLHAQMAQHIVHVLRDHLHAQMAPYTVYIIDHIHVQMAPYTVHILIKEISSMPKMALQYSYMHGNNS